MGKWLYAVYLILALCGAKIGFDLYQSAKKNGDDLFDCQKKEGAEKAKCEKDVEGRADSLSKIINSLTGRS